VAINPGTAISAVEDVLPLLDMVMVMSVNPGASGQSFIPQSLDKIRRLKTMIDEGKYSTQIEVDGGIKADWTAQDSIKAGATILVAGSAIFNDRESIPDAMKGMRGCILG
jgi:ribulose-phosphate 3-epimerase